MNVDILHPSFEFEQTQHKLKRLVQSPNSYFMDVKCPGCNSIATIFSHAQNIVTCEGCSQVLARPTGGKAKLSIGTSYRVNPSGGDVSRLKFSESLSYLFKSTQAKSPRE